ncbi:hypothetical protein KFE25_012566 [Diacronema lutheri]|uniref:Uncharacterized protein n=1 Tax=Diacronema lutheri TaxID=2081491 RepID=A0A8J6CF28_DIALT|nr:hypothetical protein KFE25_012566 [Diacronema lutheri]
MAALQLCALVDELLELDRGKEGNGGASATLAWDDAMLLCARTLTQWGGRLGRAALLAQAQAELAALARVRVRDAKAASEGRMYVEMRIEAVEFVPGAAIPLVLAMAHPVDGTGARAGRAIEIALPERLCALASVAGMAALVAPGRVLRIAGAIVPFDAALAAPVGAPPLPQLLPSEVTLPLLDGSSEDDDLLAICAVTHALGEVDADAFARGTRFTLLCRVHSIEMSSALAAEACALVSRAVAPSADARPPPEVPLSEARWARILLAERTDSPPSGVELLLVGAHALLALCLAPAGQPSDGFPLLLHEPYVQSGNAAAAERVVLRYGQATVVALVVGAAPPAPHALGAAAPPVDAGARERAHGRDGGDGGAAPTRALVTLFGSCECADGGVERTAGGRVRVTLRLLRTAGTNHDGVGQLVRVCAPAHGCAELRLPPALFAPQGAFTPEGDGARSWCALAVVHAPAARRVGGIDLCPSELATLSCACVCGECQAEAQGQAQGGCGVDARALRAAVSAVELHVLSAPLGP